MPAITVLSGVDAGKQFPIVGPTVSVGRHSSNTVALTDNRVSRRHLELRASPAGFQLFDLGSGNGTQVNGRLVQVIDLRPGDRIELGETVLRYDADPPSAPASGRLVIRQTAEASSEILRTVDEDAGRSLLAQPAAAGTEWLRSRLANLAVLYEAADAVSEILDVDELLGRIMDLVLRTADADHGCFMVTDPETGELMPKAVRTRTGLPPGDFLVSRTVVDHVWNRRQGVLVADAGADERFRGGESIARHQIREVICVPMKGRHEMVGVLFLDTRGRPDREGPLAFTEDHLNLSVAIAHQAALAVEETRYYQAFVHSERLAAVGQTIAALSHHIKNIMQGVRFGSDMVRMGLAGTDREMLLKGWRLVEKNQKKIDDLILDMLSYSKDREPLVEPTDLNHLVEEVAEVVRGRAADAGVALEVIPGTNVAKIPCDPEGIHRALLNVLSNAVDATEGRPDPRVTVTAARTPDGSMAELIVTDTGSGIPPEKVAEIFKPFVSTKGSKGTGLGLPVTKKVLVEHGGDVVVESTPGVGSRFVLHFPLR